jgi:hypothetical protein
VRWTEDEAKIPVRKEEIVGKFNVPFIFRETNRRDLRGDRSLPNETSSF